MTQDLAALVDAAGPEELIALIGQLEAARALAWARLNHGPGFCVPPGEVQDRLLTMTEVAKVLGISEHRARETGRRRELPVVQLGERQVRVSAVRLAEWVRRREDGR